jgi:hypothetical protein
VTCPWQYYELVITIAAGDVTNDDGNGGTVMTVMTGDDGGAVMTAMTV